MKDKIRIFVELQFSVKDRENQKEMIDEIVANLNDRYDEIIRQGKTDTEAFQECVLSLGDVKESLDVKENRTPAIYKPLIFMVVAILSIASVPVFLWNTLASLFLLCAAVVLFNLELYGQTRKSKKHPDEIQSLPYLIQSVRYLIGLWSLAFAMIVYETILIYFSNMDKITFQLMFLNQAAFYLWPMVFILAAIFMVPLSIWYRYMAYSVSKECDVQIPLRSFILMNKLDFSSLKMNRAKRDYFINVVFSIVLIAVTLLAKIRVFVSEVTEITPGIEMTIRRLEEQTSLLYKSVSTIILPEFQLVLIGVGLMLVFLVLTAFIKSIRKPLIFLIANSIWFLLILVMQFRLNLYVGVGYDTSSINAYMFGFSIIYWSWLILSQKVKGYYHG